MTDNDRDDDDGKRKKIIIIAIVIVLIAAAVLVFLFTKDDEKKDEGQSQDAPTISQSAPSGDDGPASATVTKQSGSETSPSSSSSSGYDDPNYSPKNVPPTTLRNQEHAPGANRDGADPMDPANATPRDVSMQAITNIFTVPITMSGTIADAFHSADKFMTPRMRNAGFKKWWDGPMNDHTFAWMSMAAEDRSNTLAVQLEDPTTKWLSDDSLRVSWKVHPVAILNSGAAPVGDFAVRTDMKYVDGKWLMDDYVFDYGKYPSIH